MRAAVFAVGNEILEGSIQDTNSSYIAKKLSDLGITVCEISALPDDLEVLKDRFERALENYDITITTGGLGPTFDDLTAEAVALASGRKLAFYEEVFDSIVSKLTKRGVKIKDSHKRQAYLPENAVLFENKKGTAYGFGVSSDKRWIFSMPGIPYEMEYIFDNHILPFIEKEFKLERLYKKDLKFTGIPESDVDEVISSIDLPKNFEVILNVSRGIIIVRLRSRNEDDIKRVGNELKKKLEKYYFGEDDETIESVVMKILLEKGVTISTVESCTGGLIAKKITDIPGVSKIFKGGLVAYDNSVKKDILKVSEKVLDNQGAVSNECCFEMLKGGSDIFGTDIVVAVTGIAGPDGGTDEKPVGTVYIGIKFMDDYQVRLFKFNGSREVIRERTANMSFKLIFEKLKRF